MKITLKDGSSKEYAQPMSVYEIALILVKGWQELLRQGKLTERKLI